MYKKGSLKSKYKHLKRMYKWTRYKKSSKSLERQVEAMLDDIWSPDSVKKKKKRIYILYIFIYNYSEDIKRLVFGWQLYKIYRMFSYIPFFLFFHFIFWQSRSKLMSASERMCLKREKIYSFRGRYSTVRARDRRTTRHLTFTTLMFSGGNDS